jgi:CRP-like cAMP-binding protein
VVRPFHPPSGTIGAVFRIAAYNRDAGLPISGTGSEYSGHRHSLACLYMLVFGEVQVVVHGVGQVALLGPNRVVGELGVLSGRPRTAECIATVETLTLRLACDEFRVLMEERPQLALGVINVLTRRLEERNAQVALLKLTSPAALEYPRSEQQTVERDP